MNFRSRIKSRPSGIQLAPMIDIFSLLLMYFILTWNLARNETELDVQVPAAKQGQEPSRAAGEIIVNIKSDGSILLNRQTISPEQLQAKLQQIAALYPDQAVILRGDEKVPYRYIVAVMDTCRAAKIWNVAFATARPSEKP